MRRRRLLLLALTAFVLFVAIRSLFPYTWSSQYITPAGVAQQSVSVRCGALWGAGTVHLPAVTPYRILGTPCGSRTSDQAMSILDMALGIAGLGGVLVWRRGRQAEPAV